MIHGMILFGLSVASALVMASVGGSLWGKGTAEATAGAPFS